MGKKDPFHPCSCFTETSGSGRSQSAHPGARRRPPLMPPGSPRNQGRLEEAPFSFSVAVGRVAGNSSCNGSNRQLLLTFGVCVLHELPRAVTRSRPGFPRSSPCGRQDKATASDLTRPRGSETDTGASCKEGLGSWPPGPTRVLRQDGRRMPTSRRPRETTASTAPRHHACDPRWREGPSAWLLDRRHGGCAHDPAGRGALQTWPVLAAGSGPLHTAPGSEVCSCLPPPFRPFPFLSLFSSPQEACVATMMYFHGQALTLYSRLAAGPGPAHC